MPAPAPAATTPLPHAPWLPVPQLRSAIRFDQERQIPFHTHETAELVFVTLGKTWIDVAGKSLEGPAGTLYILPAKVPHNQRSVGRWRTQCLLFEHAGPEFDAAARTLDLARDRLFGRWLEDLCDLNVTDWRMADPVADALLRTVLARLAKLEDQARLRESLHPSVERALAFLYAHLAEDLEAARLARAAHASYSHLSALFRARFGCGPLKHHQNLRMERARKLLLNPYLRIDEVAQQAGYTDTNYFVRVFRKSCGKPPGKWRRSR